MIPLLLSLHLTIYDLTADVADYDGKNLCLTGNFQIDHPMGHLFAEKAVVENLDLRQSLKKAHHLYLENEVIIEVLEGKTPFALSSKKAVCDLLPPFSLFQQDELYFDEQVEIRSLGESNFLAKGGSALYKNDTLTLYPSIPSIHCQIFLNGDRIDARKIVSDLSKETIVCEEPEGFLSSNALRFSARKLVYHKEEGKIHLEKDVRIWQDNLFFIEAKRGSVALNNESKPERIHLYEDIRLVSNQVSEKRSFAAADTLVYNLLDETLTLSSAAPKRVLFWQEGLRLSAPEVKIGQTTNGGIGKIEGCGDVHFNLDLEEQNTIETLISKYTGLK